MPDSPCVVVTERSVGSLTGTAASTADGTTRQLTARVADTVAQKLAWDPLASLKVTLADVQSIVATNDKQRFTLKLDGDAPTASDSPADYLVRANQGHSIKLASSSLLRPVTLADVPPRVLHGTYFAFWPAIEAAGGLKPMGRNHVHCSTGDSEDPGSGPLAVSGMRRDAELVVEIDVEASLREGIRWWRSDNGVVLTEGDDEGGLVGCRFFKKVTGRKVDVGVLWEDGEKKADLPAGLRARVPHGKGPRGRGRERGGRGRRGANHGMTR